jgi:DNA-binding response OmpR family regulator
VATTSPSERRLVVAPLSQVEPCLITEAEADRLYAEAMAAMRRAGRVAADMERAAQCSPATEWQRAAEACRRAEGSLRTAAAAVPEVPVDPALEPRRAIVVDPLSVDRYRRVAFWDGRVVRLTRMEFDLLVALAERAGEVIPKDDLLRRVWGHTVRLRTRTVDSHASRLRRALCSAGAPHSVITNVWGVGYRLALDCPERVA